jgi:hypothetical protein
LVQVTGVQTCALPIFFTVQSWGVKKVFICSNAFLYNNNHSDVLQILYKVLTFPFQCSDMKSIITTD